MLRAPAAPPSRGEPVCAFTRSKSRLDYSLSLRVWGSSVPFHSRQSVTPWSVFQDGPYGTALQFSVRQLAMHEMSQYALGVGAVADGAQRAPRPHIERGQGRKRASPDQPPRLPPPSPPKRGTLRLPPLACERLAQSTERTMLDLQAGEPAAE